MKSRERVMCALAGEQPDRVPFCEGSVAANVARALAGSDHDLSEREISDLLGRDVVVAILFLPYFADQTVGSDGQSYVTTGWIRSRADLDRMAFPDPHSPALYEDAQRVLDERGDHAAAAAIKLGVAPALLSMGLSTPLTGRVMHALPRCRVVARYGVGVDNIDLAAATGEGIVVTNVPNYCTPEVADHTVALILALARRLLPLDRFVRSGRWVGSIQFTGPIHRLSTLTLGLVGCGRIAQEVARRMAALVGEILAYDPYVDPDVAAGYGVELVDLSDLLARSDVVSLHVPLNPDTHHLLGGAELERMRPTAFLVNTSRGQVVDEGALIAALESGRIAGAALDVVATEPLPDDSPLRALPNVVLTPHFANYSVEAVRDLRESVAHAVRDVLAGRWPAHVVNGDVEPRVPLASA